MLKDHFRYNNFIISQNFQKIRLFHQTKLSRARQEYAQSCNSVLKKLLTLCKHPSVQIRSSLLYISLYDK